MGCDGPLSTDEAHSHFLDGSVCVCVCLCVSVLVYGCCFTRNACFITQELHEIVAPCRQSHFGEGPFHLSVKQIQFVSVSLVHTHTLSASVLVSII